MFYKRIPQVFLLLLMGVGCLWIWVVRDYFPLLLCGIMCLIVALIRLLEDDD